MRTLLKRILLVLWMQIIPESRNIWEKVLICSIRQYSCLKDLDLRIQNWNGFIWCLGAFLCTWWFKAVVYGGFGTIAYKKKNRQHLGLPPSYYLISCLFSFGNNLGLESRKETPTQKKHCTAVQKKSFVKTRACSLTSSWIVCW